MPPNKSYTDIESVEAYTLLDIAEEYEANVESWIIAMSNYVYNVTNRDWLADDEESEKFYNGNGKSFLTIPDYIEITDVSVGDNFGENLESKTFYTEQNTPITKVYLKDDIFPVGVQNIAIEGILGFAEEVPEDIKWATTVLVAGIVFSQQKQNGEITSEKIGNYSVSYDTDKQKADYQRAMDILNSRRLIVL